jgi:two-component system, NarL family, response regulator NreC
MIHVLLADDHRMVRDSLRFILEAPGDLKVAGLASNGQEAVEQAQQGCPDVAVIDVSMPVMDGLEAARQILANCPHTRVLMLSMYNTTEYVFRALKAGAAGYMIKDAAGSELIEAVRTLNRGESYFSPSIAEIVRQIRKKDGQ